MASGQIFGLFPVPPLTLFATIDTITGASSPAESVAVWNFDDTTTEYMDFYGMAVGYGGSGFTLRLPWAGAAAANDVRWGAAIRRIQDDAEDLDTTAHTYVFNDAVDDAAPTVIGEVTYTEITFTDGADADDLANNEAFILRVRRTAATSNMSGDARLLQTPVFKET